MSWEVPMGWKDKLGLGEAAASRPPADPPPASTEWMNWRNVEVVGESHYQDALWAATGLKKTSERVQCQCIAELVLEPDNPVDPRAIMVQVRGKCVGYLSRGVARRYGKRIREMQAAGQPAICDAFIGGLVEGDENPNLGITLKFPVQEDGEYVIEPGGAEISRRVLAERDAGGAA